MIEDVFNGTSGASCTVSFRLKFHGLREEGSGLSGGSGGGGQGRGLLGIGAFLSMEEDLPGLLTEVGTMLEDSNFFLLF